MRDIIILVCCCLLSIFFAGSGERTEPYLFESNEKSITNSQFANAGPFFQYLSDLLDDYYSNSDFYKVSRDLMIAFFVLLLILEVLIIKEWLMIRKEEEAGLIKQRLQQDLESQTRQGLQEKLAQMDRQLALANLALEEKNKMLSLLQSDLKDVHTSADLETRSKLRPISRSIDRNLKKQNAWTQFQVHFGQVHPRFFDRLQKQFPTLNANDLRLCAYLRLNLSTKEIANLLHINHNSVQKARYRLKKKLNLPSHEDLLQFIHRI